MVRLAVVADHAKARSPTRSASGVLMILRGRAQMAHPATRIGNAAVAPAKVEAVALLLAMRAMRLRIVVVIRRAERMDIVRDAAATGPT